jgi:hypothetical protein
MCKATICRDAASWTRLCRGMTAGFMHRDNPGKYHDREAEVVPYSYE